MRYLDEILAREDVQILIDRCRKSRAVQGVIADIDPLWLHAWRLKERQVPLDSAFFGPPVWWEDTWLGFFVEAGHLGPMEAMTSNDLNWKPRRWNDIARRRGFRDISNPVRLRICLYPRWKNPDEEDRPAMPELSDLNVNYVFEPRPIPRFAANPTTMLSPLIGGGGIGVGTSGPGTLGGLLRDGNGNFYGVTCAHVASARATVDHPSQADTNAPNPIGKVAYFQLPTPYPSNLPLTPAQQAANANEVDAALIQLDPTIATRLEVDGLGLMTGLCPSSSVQQWQATTFAGRTSGVRTVEFRGKMLYYNVPAGVGTVCFKDLFEIQWPPPVSASAGPPIQQGDSGAWLCVSGSNGYEWAAIAVAWDPTMGFAIPASSMQSWWQGYNSSLQPF